MFCSKSLGFGVFVLECQVSAVPTSGLQLGDCAAALFLEAFLLSVCYNKELPFKLLTVLSDNDSEHNIKRKNEEEHAGPNPSRWVIFF